jgi:23S rRNA pseudouridine2605 synthase
VTVDGRVARLGDQVDPETAIIAVDGRSSGRPAARVPAPAQAGRVTSTVRDRHAERTVLDLLPTALVPEGARLYPVGRLDLDSEGMLILTNDGDWAERVLHPRFGVEREYALATGRPLDGRPGRGSPAGIELDEGHAT